LNAPPSVPPMGTSPGPSSPVGSGPLTSSTVTRTKRSHFPQRAGSRSVEGRC